MAGSKVKQKPYIPHPNAPSARLATEQADNSGVVNTDPQFMADRLAILNHVGAYAYLIDEGRWEEWFALFADDFEFVSTTPTLGTVTIRGQNAFREFVGDRYIKGGRLHLRFAATRPGTSTLRTKAPRPPMCAPT